MSRFSEESFNRFALVISDALACFPSPVKVRWPGKPSGIMQPLRDAIRAKQKHGYTHPLVSDALFSRHSKDLQVWEQGGHVWCGKKSKKEQELSTEKDTQEFLVRPEFIVGAAQLIAMNAFIPTPHFIVTGTTEACRNECSRLTGAVFHPHSSLPDTYEIV